MGIVFNVSNAVNKCTTFPLYVLTHFFPNNSFEHFASKVKGYEVQCLCLKLRHAVTNDWRNLWVSLYECSLIALDFRLIVTESCFVSHLVGTITWQSISNALFLKVTHASLTWWLWVDFISNNPRYRRDACVLKFGPVVSFTTS